MSLRGRRPWQSMVGIVLVCGVDCFATLAKTEWGSQRRSGARKDGVGFAKTEWGSQRRSGARNDGVCLCEVVDRGSPWLCTALFAGQVLLNLVYRIVCCRIGV